MIIHSYQKNLSARGTEERFESSKNTVRFISERDRTPNTNIVVYFMDHVC